jgi:hypothetical protein
LPILRRSGNRLATNENKREMHLKKGVGSDWIWPISGNRLAPNENEGEMH